jgi:hypothetical protein
VFSRDADETRMAVETSRYRFELSKCENSVRRCREKGRGGAWKLAIISPSKLSNFRSTLGLAIAEKPGEERVLRV